MMKLQVYFSFVYTFVFVIGSLLILQVYVLIQMWTFQKHFSLSSVCESELIEEQKSDSSQTIHFLIIFDPSELYSAEAYSPCLLGPRG